MRVRAPASTANLGPGFDCLGAALSIGLEIRAAEGAERSPDSQLIRRAVAAAGGPLDASVEVVSEIPVARGLGSSAACVAAGLLAGCALSGNDLDRGELLRLGTRLEGHPDNLAAALYGGVTLVLPGGEVLRFTPVSSVRPFILLPHERLPTAEARAALPDHVPREDAVANIARASGLLALLSGAVEPTRERLLACTEDLIHQRFRAPLMPRTSDALKRLRREGFPAAVSGAGPAIVCLVVAGEEDSTRQAVGTLEGWELLELDWDLTGARIVKE